MAVTCTFRIVIVCAQLNTAQYLVITKHCIFPFILIYLSINSYIVNKALKCMGAQPLEMKQHKMETGGIRENETRGLYHRQAPEVPALEEPLR